MGRFLFFRIFLIAVWSPICQSADCSKDMVQYEKEIQISDALRQSTRQTYEDCKQSFRCTNTRLGCWCDGPLKKSIDASQADADLAAKYFPRKNECCTKFDGKTKYDVSTAIVKECGVIQGSEAKIACYDLAEACLVWSRGDKSIPAKFKACKQWAGEDQASCLANYYGEMQRLSAPATYNPSSERSNLPPAYYPGGAIR